MYEAIKREIQRDRLLEKLALDAAKYVGKGRMIPHILGGAALGGVGGAAMGDEGHRQDSALRGAMYGAAGGLGYSHKTAPVLQKRVDEMQKFEAKNNTLLKRVIPGAKKRMEAKAQAHMKELMKRDKQEMFGEGLTGAGFGLGLGITAGTVADRIRGGNTQQPMNQVTPFGY